MILTNEADTLMVTVTDAIDLAAECKLADSYVCHPPSPRYQAGNKCNSRTASMSKLMDHLTSLFDSLAKILPALVTIGAAAQALLGSLAAYSRARYLTSPSRIQQPSMKLQRIQLEESLPPHSPVWQYVLLATVCFFIGVFAFIGEEQSNNNTTLGLTWLLFWMFLALYFVYGAIKFSNDKGKSSTVWKAEVVVDGDYEEVFDYCKSAINTGPMRVIDLDRQNGSIGARTGAGLDGERITLVVNKTEGGQCMIRIESVNVCTGWDPLHKNRLNVERFLQDVLGRQDTGDDKPSR